MPFSPPQSGPYGKGLLWGASRTGLVRDPGNMVETATSQDSGGEGLSVAKYWEGVWAVASLKYRLNDDLELNPQSYARERRVNCWFLGMATSRLNSASL